MNFSTSVLLGLLLASSSEVICSKFSEYLLFDPQRPHVKPEISEIIRDSIYKSAGNTKIQEKQKWVEKKIFKIDSNDSENHSDDSENDLDDFENDLDDSENTQNGNPTIIQTIPRSLQVVHILDKLNKDQAPHSHEGTISMFGPGSVISKLMKQAKENESQSNTEKGSDVVVDAEANDTTASSDKTPEEAAEDKDHLEVTKVVDELIENVERNASSPSLSASVSDTKSAKSDHKNRDLSKDDSVIDESTVSGTLLDDSSKSKFPWKAFLLSAGGLVLVAAIVSAVYIASQTIQDEESVDL